MPKHIRSLLPPADAATHHPKSSLSQLLHKTKFASGELLYPVKFPSVAAAAVGTVGAHQSATNVVSAEAAVATLVLLLLLLLLLPPVGVSVVLKLPVMSLLLLLLLLGLLASATGRVGGEG